MKHEIRDGAPAIKTDDELRQLALDIVQGRVFTSNHLPDDTPPQMLETIFLVLGLMSPEQAQVIVDAEPTLFYEYNDKAVRYINDWPCFLSCSYLRRTEHERLNKFVVMFREKIASGTLWQ